MTGMFVCIVEPRLDCRAKGPRHAVIRIMRSWSQRKDNQTCVLLCSHTFAHRHMCRNSRQSLNQSSVSDRQKSRQPQTEFSNLYGCMQKLPFCSSPQRYLTVCTFVLHKLCQNWKKLSTHPPKHTHTHTSWFPLERIPLLWAWHLRRWLYKPLVNALWFPNAE